MITFLCFAVGFLIVNVWDLRRKVAYQKEFIDSLRKCFDHQAEFDEKIAMHLRYLDGVVEKLHQENSKPKL